MRLGTANRRVIGRAARVCAGLLRDASGSVVFYAALVMPMLLAFVGLAADVGNWYAAKRTAQSAADAAAIAATYEIVRESGETAREQAAWEDALLNGFDPDAGDAMTVCCDPPTTGPNAGDATAVEVVIERTPPTFFSQMLFSDPVKVVARAVAMVVRPESCVWLLEKTDTALNIPGSANVELDCGVYAQSTSPAAIDVSGSGCLTTTSNIVSGGTAGTCITPLPRTDVPQLGDPLAHIQPPSYGGCDYNNKLTITGDVELPGNKVYCNGIHIAGGAHVTFGAGVHVLAGGTLTIQGGATVRGSEVTFYLTDGAGGYATVTSNAGDIELSAPTTGDLAGILFFQDRAAPTSTSNSLAGNADQRLTGTLYFPTAILDYAGGSAASPTETIIVARKLNFVGGTYLKAADSLTLYPSGLVPVALVE